MQDQISGRPTWAEINLDNLNYNFQTVKQFVSKPVKFMAVVKADAYGHGAARCARKLDEAGVDWFGVALPEEGVELRKEGIKKPILCLGGFWAGQEKIILENDLTPVLYQAEKAEILDQAAQELKVRAKAHIKVDTGMGRIGVRFDDLDGFGERLKRLSHINFDGIMTHFAAADNFAEKDFTRLQIERFKSAVGYFEKKGFQFNHKDLANSPASLAYPESYGTLIRLGGILYGLGEDVLPKWVERPAIRPVMSLYSKISFLKKVKKGETIGYGRSFRAERDSVIASIPIGYQDGYRRGLSNKARVIVNGKFASVVGRISMDWTILDVTDIPEVSVGDQVVLIGKQGGHEIIAEELAEKVDTISYEITCGIDRRVRRVYVESK